jgi:2-amino-4-hydroxy-6-hydroxymethyldihydropteridine diphosphokinase
MPNRRVRAYIGLGANVGSPKKTLAAAIRALSARPGLRVRGVSRLYLTRPVGVTDQPDFHNAVLALEVSTSDSAEEAALELLAALKDLERGSGRRTRGRWGPRELDLDLLLFGRARMDVARSPEARSSDPGRATTDQRLVVPHPRARERLFVLAPLADLAPGLVPPGWAETVEHARRRQLGVEGPDAVRAIATWDAAASDWRP